MKLRPLHVSALLLALAACTPPQEPPAVDYREKYPIGVTSETVSLALPVPTAAGGFASEDEIRLDAVLAGYLDRGHGPLTVVVGPPGAMPGFAELSALRERLLESGVAENAIRLVSLPQVPAGTLLLRYERFNVLVPSCGDWSSDPGRNPRNDVHSNFGCAVQRGIGLMVADPADLVRMRQPSPTDAQNSNRVVQRHRKGEPPAAVPTPLQVQGGAGIVKQ